MLKLTDAQRVAYLHVDGKSEGVVKEELESVYDTRVLNNLITKKALVIRDHKYFSQGNWLETAETERKDTEMAKGNGNGKTKKVKKERVVKTAKPTTMCLCGCQETTAPGRLFLQGHDARLRGQVLARLRGEEGAPAYPRRAETLDYLKNAHWMTPAIRKEIGI